MMNKKQEERYKPLVNAVKNLSKIGITFTDGIRGNTMLKLPIDLNGHRAYYQRINYHDGQYDIIELTNGKISKKVINVRSTYSPARGGTRDINVEYAEDILTDGEIDKVTRVIEKITNSQKTKKKIKDGDQKILY